MQKIVPNLWFDTQAEEAVQFYADLFSNAKILHTVKYGKAGAEVSGRPEGSIMTIAFQLEGQEFIALNGGPMFTFSPAISLFVSCATEDEVDRLFQKLSAGGKVLMELQAYPFSPRYAWVEDRYGVSWQLHCGARKQRIAAALLFVGAQYGNAERAMEFYVKQFPNARVETVVRYEAREGETAGTVKFGVFVLDGQEFMAMDSGYAHAFTFTPAISLLVHCETQEEIDRLWERLSEGGSRERCGWLRDVYGVTWQIVPAELDAMMTEASPEQSERIMCALLRMQKLGIAELRKAYAEE
ncbi:VOC family protein [Candidatus Uhrbacteria bacterium]|nr:VOC family protein [Candidatus Uhrbacteria bacterium]